MTKFYYYKYRLIDTDEAEITLYKIRGLLIYRLNSVYGPPQEFLCGFFSDIKDILPLTLTVILKYKVSNFDLPYVKQFLEELANND